MGRQEQRHATISGGLGAPADKVWQGGQLLHTTQATWACRRGVLGRLTAATPINAD